MILLTIEQVAQQLSVTERTVKRLIASNKLAYIPISARVKRIEPSALAEYIDSQREACQSAKKRPALLLSSSAEETEFTDACQKVRRGNRRKSLRPDSARVYSIK